MNRLKSVSFGFIGAAAIAFALVAGLVASSQVSAADEAVSVGSATVVLGGQTSVDLKALNMDDPGLGAWTIDITYDPLVLDAVSCSASQGVCNAAFGDATVRATGAAATGLEGDTTLAGITFECGDEEGTSALTLTLQVFADATIGAPADVDAATQNGIIACVEAPPPPPTATVGPPATSPPSATSTTVPGATSTPTVAAPLAHAVVAGDRTIAVGDVTGFSVGDTIVINPGRSNEERAVIIAIDSATGTLFVLSAFQFDHATGEPVVLVQAAIATATPGAGLPKAGSGGPGWDAGSPRSWLIAGLAGAGIAWLIAGLAGAGLATVGASSTPGLRATRAPDETTTIFTSRAEPPVTGAGGATSGRSSAVSWLAAAREELSGVGLTGVAGFRALRRRTRR